MMKNQDKAKNNLEAGSHLPFLFAKKEICGHISLGTFSKVTT